MRAHMLARETLSSATRSTDTIPMHRRTLVLTALTLSLTIAPLAGADHGCNENVTQIDTPAGTLYLDQRSGGPFDVWIYQESNGAAGLQSGGPQALGLWSDECSHDVPDTLIF